MTQDPTEQVFTDLQQLRACQKSRWPSILSYCWRNDVCECLYKKFQGLKRSRKSKLTERSAFANLPIFILQIITAVLPLSSQAALALTSKSMCNIIGNLSKLCR